MFNLTTAIVLFATVLLFVAYKKSRRPDNAPPGPFAWPFVGNLLNVALRPNFHRRAHQHFLKYGPLTSLQMAFYPAVMISDKDVMKEALLDHGAVMSTRPGWLPFTKVLLDGVGLIYAAKDQWRSRKNMLLHAFKQLGFGSATFEKAIQAEVGALIHALKEVEGQMFQFKMLFNKATSNVLSALTIGKRYDYSDAELQYILLRLHSLMQMAGFRNMFCYLPKWANVLLPIMDPKALRGYKDLNEVYTLLNKWVKQHKEVLEPGQPRDLVDIALEADMSDRDVQQLLLEMLLGGAETTSNAFLWAFLFMIRHPDIQERCRAEIQEVCGDDRLPCMEDKEKLPYTSATIMEILRFDAATSAPMLNCDETLELRGYTLKKDTLIILNLYSVHMDPKNWDQPEEFRPERFLSTDQQTVIKPEAFMPFSIGNRSCLGENLAMMEMFIIFSSLIQKFRFSAPDPDNLPTIYDATFSVNLVPKPYDVCVKSV